jgi:hypothetical protein
MYDFDKKASCDSLRLSPSFYNAAVAHETSIALYNNANRDWQQAIRVIPHRP